MALPKPSSKPDWTVSNPSPVDVRTEPSGAKKIAGWVGEEAPLAEHFNWLFFNVDEWIDYFESVTDDFIGYQSIYAAFVGSGGLATHADLNSAIAAVAAGSRILVLSSAVLNNVQSISKNNLTIEFQPGVVYSKGTAQYALQVQADNVTIIGGQFQGFSAGGNAGIRVDALCDFTKILNSHFKTNATDVDDQGNDTVIAQTTTET